MGDKLSLRDLEEGKWYTSIYLDYILPIKLIKHKYACDVAHISELNKNHLYYDQMYCIILSHNQLMSIPYRQHKNRYRELTPEEKIELL